MLLAEWWIRAFIGWINFTRTWYNPGRLAEALTQSQPPTNKN